MGERGKKQTGPPGLADWEALYPRLFEVHGQPIGELEAMEAALVQAGDDGTEPLRELLEIMREHPIRVRRKPDGWLFLDWPQAWESEEAAPIIERASGLFYGHEEEAKGCWSRVARPA